MELTSTIFNAGLHLTEIQINWFTFYQPSNKGNTDLRQISLELSFFLRREQESFFFLLKPAFRNFVTSRFSRERQPRPQGLLNFQHGDFSGRAAAWKAEKNPWRIQKRLRNIPFWNASPDKPLHYLWVNTSCHPEYGDIFGIYPDNLPVLLFAKPKQRLFTILRGELTTDKVGEVVEQIFQGEEELSPFSRLNDMLPINCHETKAQSTKPSKKDRKVKT